MPIELTTTSNYKATCDWCHRTGPNRGTRVDAMFCAFENGWEFTQGQARTQVVLCYQCAKSQPMRKQKKGR